MNKLMENCQGKLKELENIKSEQDLQIKKLNLVMAEIELRKMDFQEKFDRKANKFWVENLENQLAIIKNIKNRTNNVKRKKDSLEREHYILKRKFEKNEISELQFNVAKIRLEMQNKDIDNILDDLKNEKDTFIKGGVIANYKSKHYDFMCHFFEELNDEFEKPSDSLDHEQPEKYRFPETLEDIIGFIDKQQKTCREYLKEAHEKRKQTDEELKMFRKRFKDFDKQSKNRTYYENDTLKAMKRDLERSIEEKTSFISKISSYLNFPDMLGQDRSENELQLSPRHPLQNELKLNMKGKESKESQATLQTLYRIRDPSKKHSPSPKPSSSKHRRPGSKKNPK